MATCLRILSTLTVEYLMKAKLFVLALAAMNVAPVMARTVRDLPPGPTGPGIWAWAVSLFCA